MSAVAVKYVRQLDEVKKVNRHVLAELAWLANEKGECFASVAKLSEWSGWGQTAVKAALQWLKAGGYLQQTKRGRANAFASDYRLTFKGQKSEAAQTAAAGYTVARRPFLGSPDDSQYGEYTDITNQHLRERLTPYPPKVTDNSQSLAPKQFPSLPLFSERSEKPSEKAKFGRLRAALVNLTPTDSGLEAWLNALQHACDNVEQLHGRDVLAAWYSCGDYRAQTGLRKPTRQDFAGWLLHEWPAAEDMVMGGSLAAA